MNKQEQEIYERISREKFRMLGSNKKEKSREEIREERKTMFYAHVFNFVTIDIDFDITDTACVYFSNKGSTINMAFNPNFVSKLTDKQLRTLITHEVMHITNEHFYRIGKRDKSLWNVATDLSINSILKNEGFAEIEGWLIPETYGFSCNLSAEEYYKKLIQNRKIENKNVGHNKSNDSNSQENDSKGQENKNLGNVGNDNSENREVNKDNNEEKTIDDHSYWEKVKKTENNSKGQENKNLGNIGNDNSENREANKDNNGEKTIDDHSCLEKVKKAENNSKGQENKNICLNNSDDSNSQDNSSKEQENKNIDSTESFDNSNDSNKKDEVTKKNNNSKEYRKINKTDISNIKTKIKEAIETAYNETKKKEQGYDYIPAYIEQYMQTLRKPSIINWKRVLKTQIQSSVKNNHRKSYLRPSRRYSNNKFIFKGKVPDRIAKIIVAIDTSGSIENEDFNMFMNEIYVLHKEYPIELRIIQCDTQVQSDIIYKKNQKIETRFGRGGTDFRPVFEYINNNKYRVSNDLINNSTSKYQTYKSKVRNNPNLLIFFTDGYGSYPEPKYYPRYKVLWCIVGDYHLNKIPFGLKVKLEKIFDK